MVPDDVQQIVDSDDEEFETVDSSANNGDYVEFGIQTHLNRPPLAKNLRLCLAMCGIINITLSVISVGCGVATMTLAGNRMDSSHFYTQTNFAMLILTFSGAEALRKAYKDSFTSVACLLVLSSLSAMASACNAAAQISNLNFSGSSLEVKLEALTLVYSLVCALINTSQIVIALKAISVGRVRVSFNNYDLPGHRAAVLCFLGLFQVVFGIFFTIILIVLDTSGLSFDVNIIFKGDLYCLGWLVSSAGIALLVPYFCSTSKCLVYSAAALQGLTLVTIVQFLTVPSATLYMIWNRAELTVRVCSVGLTLATVLTMVSLMYAFYTLTLHVCTRDANIDNKLEDLMKNRWPLYGYTPMCQLSLAAFYVLLSIIGFFEKFLYVTDFTPMPLFMLCHVIMSYQLRKHPNPALLIVNFACITLCELFALRGVYLFDYHTAVSNTPDALPTSGNGTRSTGASKVGVHISMAAVALMEMLMGMALTAMYMRTLFDSTLFVFDKILFRGSYRALQYTSVVQLLCAAIMLNLAFVTFLSKSLVTEMFGDHSLYTGALVLLTSIICTLATRMHNLLPFAFVLQSVTSFFGWQIVDYCSEMLLMLLKSDVDMYRKSAVNEAMNNLVSAQRLVAISIATFVLFIAQLTFGGVNILLMVNIVVNGKYRAKTSTIEMSNIT